MLWLRLSGDGIVLEATISPDGRTLVLPSPRSTEPDRRGIGASIKDLLQAVGLVSRKPPVVNVITLREAATGRLIGRSSARVRISRARSPSPPTAGRWS